ncbi:MAG: low molecular weight phosphotyrosine protein phosphatase [Gammaproteobacteria bacterium]|nr:low molecular weight phosphotyrosine protein phosphatase [Gammaproteobacteria bacterium]
MSYSTIFNKFTNLFARASDVAGVVESSPKVKVLFVCMGNLCRSPTAQGVFEKLVAQAGLARVIGADSAGTHAYHIGKSPDKRAVAAASKRGYDLTRQRARRIETADLSRFDYILAMDDENVQEIRALVAPEGAGNVWLLMDFARQPVHAEVPDPYYGGGGGFERVLDLVEDGARGLLEHIRRHHQL